MRLLNAGCGGSRPQDEHWINLDNLRTQLKEGTPERTNLDRELRYVEHDLLNPLPFSDNHFDGCIAVHVVEHLTCHESVGFLSECKRVLKPGGLLVVSVPDASYFIKTYSIDTKERAVELFGEPIHDAGFEKFFDYALFRHDHKQVLTIDSLICLIWGAGFVDNQIAKTRSDTICGGDLSGNPVYLEMEKLLSRRKFSVEVTAIK